LTMVSLTVVAASRPLRIMGQAAGDVVPQWSPDMMVVPVST